MKPNEPIAIVGIGCRFPGAPDPETFWRILCDGQETVADYSEKRFDYLDSIYSEDSVRRGLIASCRGGFLPNLDLFDAAFFHISPHEAGRLDPQQRLLLETAWEAVEDAGIPGAKLAGTNTGVFVGLWCSDYEDCLYENSRNLDFYASTGGGRYPASGRLAYFLDLRGPNLAVDTACSSSLVAVHLACKSLQRGESDVALAGGVNCILRPEITLIYSASGMLSPEGRCKFGDAAANGYVRSEGAGVLVLKTLSRALSDGDSIYALICGSAVNNDGHSSGLLISPSREGQQAMLRAAFVDAGIDPQAASYIEAHGTGTLAGDPVEIESIAAVVASQSRSRPCAIGSAKTNIGHTESAAGIAGIIKVALALREGLLPGSLHFQTPNPAINWDHRTIEVHSKTGPWRTENGSLIAGVSGFGITGTNAHIVLERHEEERLQQGHNQENLTRPSASSSRPELFLLSGHTENVLETVASNWHDRLAEDPNWPASLSDLAYTAATRRHHHEYRCAIVTETRDELIEHLGAWLRKEDQPYAHSGKRSAEGAGRVAFIFPGQGGQWPGMAQSLLEDEPAFRDKLEECDAAVFCQTGWHVIDKLRNAPEQNFKQIDIIQPVLFSVMVSLAALWRSYGVEPHAVAGHSMGEIAAAVVSGALTLDDGTAIICTRSALMKGASGRGLMALTELSFDAAQDLIRKYNGRVSIAAQNSANSTVLSGDADAIEDALVPLEAREIFCRRISVDVASHSFHVEPFCKELPARLPNLKSQRGALPIYSTVTGNIEEGVSLNADYWARNLRQPVLFHSAIQNLLRDGFDTFVEINAHPVLLQAVEDGIRQSGREAIAVSSLRRDKPERAEILDSLGALFVHGLQINWEKLYPLGTVLRLPVYSYQRERYWLDSRSLASPRSGLTQSHPNLGARVDSSLEPASHFWPVEVPTNQSANDRAALCIDLIVAASKDILPADASHLTFENLQFNPPCLSACEAQLAARRLSEAQIEFRASSRVESAWSLESSAILSREAQPNAALPAAEMQRSPIDAVDKSALAAVFDQLAAAACLPDQQNPRIARIDQLIWYASSQAPARLEWSRSGDPSNLRFDCLLKDEKSRPVATLLGLQIESASPSAADQVIYEARWLEHHPSATKTTTQRSTYILVGDSGLTKNLAKEFKAHHDRCLIASGPDALAEFLRAEKNIRGVLVIAPSTNENDSSRAFELADRIVETVQSVARESMPQPPRLWLITSGAQHLSSGERQAVIASHGPAWGLGRVIAREHPELLCTNVDLPAASTASDLRALTALFHSNTDEEHLAIRAGKSFAARLTHRGPAPVNQPLRFVPDATFRSGWPVREHHLYLLTGGSGGIGVELTDWLVRNGAKHIALISRRPPSSEAQSRLDVLCNTGAEIRWFAADVSDAAQIKSALDQIQNEMPPLRGIFHLAAATDGALITDLTPQRLGKVFAPKAAGAWNLHRQTQNLPLDFFVMFSSVAPVLSQPGQASYAAANSYTDALARHRRALGLKAVSIQFGPWSGIGLALEEGAIRSVRAYQEQGIEPLPLQTALEVVSTLIESNSGAANYLVLPVDWSKFTQSYSGENIPSLFRELATSSQPQASDSNALAASSATQNLRQSLQNSPEGPSRRTVLEKHLQEVLASILKTTAQRIDPLKPMGSLGVDSLTALRFVRRLATTTGAKLPATAVFNYPTVRLLAVEVARRMEISLSRVSDSLSADENGASSKTNGDSTVTVPSSVEDLSEDDAIRTLLGGPRHHRSDS